MRHFLLLCVISLGSGNSNSSNDPATDADATVGSDATADTPDAHLGARPHPQYPSLDLDTLPGAGGGAIGAYTPPTLPTTTRTVTISSTGIQAASDILSECQTGGAIVTVPNAAGDIGVVTIGNADDCDLIFGDEVVIGRAVIGNLSGNVLAPSQRIRVRGGRFGGIHVYPGTTDIVFDSVIVDNNVNGAANRQNVGVYLRATDLASVERLAFVNSVIRMLPTLPSGTRTDGAAYMGDRTRNIAFANNNIVTAGNDASWGFRLNGAHNTIIMDNVTRVSFHKLIRMNGYEVDYVYVKGGIWMREDTQSSAGGFNNDSFQQLGDDGTENIYIHDTEVYLRSPTPVMCVRGCE